MEHLLNCELEEIKRLQEMVKALRKSNAMLHGQCMELLEENGDLLGEIGKLRGEKGGMTMDDRPLTMERGPLTTDDRPCLTNDIAFAEKTAEKKPEEWRVKKKVRELGGDVKRHEFVVRAQARMLMKLHENREYGIEPKLLFAYTGVKKLTGYRYISMLKKRNFLRFIGARRNGKYILTRSGVEMVEG